jgi:2-C-methyl-D-erythritol 4-phosphate cytidylyltransferase
MAANGRSTVAAILVAAGSGERLGADVPKAFVLVDGTSLLGHAFVRFDAHPAIDVVVVVAPASHVDEASRLTGATVVAGGDTRQASVAAGLDALPLGIELVLVHDVARPFVPDSVIDAVVTALRDGADAVVPVVPIHDTVRRVDPDGTLAEVVDRSTLAAVQTPQGFRRDVLVAAHQQGAGLSATDDAALIDALGRRVVAVPGADEAFKITTPLDLARAETVAHLRSSPRPSIPGGIP